jgi:hypothetical protein
VGRNSSRDLLDFPAGRCIFLAAKRLATRVLNYNDAPDERPDTFRCQKIPQVLCFFNCDCFCKRRAGFWADELFAFASFNECAGLDHPAIINGGRAESYVETEQRVAEGARGFGGVAGFGDCDAGGGVADDFGFRKRPA